MSSKLRFATAREVFEAFPSAKDDIQAPPTEESPIAFARARAAGPTPEDALSFCAYLLPRREAVWWACESVRVLTHSLSPGEYPCIEAAEAWVRQPEDALRRQALALGMAGNRNAAATWAALAAGWSGGTLQVGEHAVPVAPHLTARAVRIAVLTSLARVPATDRAARIRGALDSAVRLAGGGG